MIYAIGLIILALCDPALAALFTPPGPELGRYEVCTSPDGLEPVGAAAARDGWHLGDIEALESRDAYGTAGPYDRSRLARLYGGTRVRVVHGWKESADGFESVTFFSPYPDAALTRLNAGTMEIRWVLQRSTQSAQNTQSQILSAGPARSAVNVVIPD